MAKKTKIKKTKSKPLIVLVVLLALVLLINFYIIYKIFHTLEIRKIDASIIVSEKIGFDLNNSALTFGGVLKGGSSSREISIENKYKFPIEIKASGEGEMRKFIAPSVSKVPVGRKETIKITASVPLDAEFGEYRGKIVIEIKKDI